MSIIKETKGLNMPWEKEYGYSQGVKVGDTIYVAGQVSHDDAGNIVGEGDMEKQMMQAYSNISRVLGLFGASIDDVVEEVLYVVDMESAFPARAKCQNEVFAGFPAVASTIVQIDRLAFPQFLIEIKCIARV